MADRMFTPGPLISAGPLATHFKDGCGREVLDVPQPNGMSRDEWLANKRLYPEATKMYALLERMEKSYCGADPDSFLDALEEWRALRAKIDGDARTNVEGGGNG